MKQGQISMQRTMLAAQLSTMHVGNGHTKIAMAPHREADIDAKNIMAGHPTPCMHNGHTETAMAPIERGQI
jgi:hypothetical protein